MTDTPWTYNEFHHTPSRKTHRVMEGWVPVAICKREKHARLIVRLYNERLHKELVKAQEA